MFAKDTGRSRIQIKDGNGELFAGYLQESQHSDLRLQQIFLQDSGDGDKRAPQIVRGRGWGFLLPPPRDLTSVGKFCGLT